MQLDNVWMEGAQAKIQDLPLKVAYACTATVHELDGKLLPCLLILCKLHEARCAFIEGADGLVLWML